MSQKLIDLSLKKRAKTFYFASLFFSKEKRNDIEKLYLFCRFIDDLGDDNIKSNKQSKLILKRIQKELITKKSDNEIITNFINLMTKHKINYTIPNDLINGVLSDLKTVDIKNYDQLFTYSYKVAGTVGLMMCMIMDVNKKSLKIEGIYLGIAMQLTNIARDIKEDLKRGRIYFPEEIRGNIKNEFLNLENNRQLQNKFSINLKELINTSDIIYSLAWEGIIKLPIKYRIPIAIASYLYQSIGKKIQKKNYNIWKERIYLNKLEKFMKIFNIIYKLIFDKKINSNTIIKNKLDKIINNIYSIKGD